MRFAAARLQLAQRRAQERAGCAVRPWSGGGEAEVVARCVEGSAELVGVAADLGEEEAALDAGHGGSGERGWVGVGAPPVVGYLAGGGGPGERFAALLCYI